MGTRFLWPHSPAVGRGESLSAGCSHPPARLPREIGGLLIEYGGVLYDDTVWQRWLWQVLARLGLHANYGVFFHVWQHEYLDDVHRGRRDLCEALEAFLLSVGLSRGQIDEVEAACRSRRLQLEEETKPLPGVKAALRQLNKNKLLLAVSAESDHPAELLQHRLERSGLSALFVAVVSSAELGATKPNPVSYLAALETMKLPAERVAYLGHDTGALAGAAEVGMHTVAFNFDHDAQADVYLGHFEELIQAVGTPHPLTKAG
jgi:FMN phosphatase YigB (HAD superfamily)